jgi:hypothetical protein
MKSDCYIKRDVKVMVEEKKMSCEKMCTCLTSRRYAQFRVKKSLEKVHRHPNTTSSNFNVYLFHFCLSQIHFRTACLLFNVKAVSPPISNVCFQMNKSICQSVALLMIHKNVFKFYVFLCGIYLLFGLMYDENMRELTQLTWSI